MSDRTANDIAVDRQGHFDAYMVALTFTVLGLSIQSSSLGRWIVADVLQLLGWVALLIAGLAGLKRLETIPEHYRVQHLRDVQEDKQRTAAIAARERPATITMDPVTGATRSVGDYLVEVSTDLPKLKERLKELDRGIVLAYRIQARAFVAGVCLTAAARAVPAVAHVAQLAGYRIL